MPNKCFGNELYPILIIIRVIRVARAVSRKGPVVKHGVRNLLSETFLTIYCVHQCMCTRMKQYCPTPTSSHPKLVHLENSR